MRRILLVDDEEILTRTLAETLKSQLEVTIVTAHSGHEAIAILFHERFDVVVVDYHMPNGNGADVLRFLARQSWPTLSVLFTSELRPTLPPMNKYFLGIVEKPNVKELFRKIVEAISPYGPPESGG